MKRILFLLICLGFVFNTFAQTVSGRVYEGATGTEPPNSSYLANVTVELWGSNNKGTLQSKLDNTTTDANGWYGLSTQAVWEFYYIKEIDPSGYSSNGATTVSGTVINANLIEYEYPIFGKTTTGNKFWDSPPAPRNNPPVSDCNGPYTGYVGQPVTFDGTGSYDPDAGDSISKYEWDLDKDHVYDDASGATPQKTFNTAGWYSVALRVYDTHNAASGRDSTYLQIIELDKENGLIKGFKFYDLNKNGVRDAGEHGLINWQIYLDLDNDGQYEYSTTTDSSGGYAFTDVPPGTHKVFEGIPSGWYPSYPANGYHLVTVVAGGVYDDLDFGNYRGESEYEFDFGDVPTPPYDGSWQRALHQTFYLGSLVDADNTHQSDPQAMGDDVDGTDDEDGVTLTSALIPGLNASLSVVEVVQGIDKGWLTIWIDFNQDNNWDKSEMVLDTMAWAGTYSFSFLVPGTALTGTTFMRAMLTDVGPVNMSGIPYGEIEDYEVEIGRSGSISIVKIASPADDTPFPFQGDLGSFTLMDPSASAVGFWGVSPGSYEVKETLVAGWSILNIIVSGDTDNGSTVDLTTGKVSIDYDSGENITVIYENIKESDEGLDFGDAPDSYRTVAASMGPGHTINPDVSLGKVEDAEADGQPSVGANEDDLNGTPDDEDGVQPIGPLTPGASSTAKIEIENRGNMNEYAHIAGWIDFNRDGQFQLTENIGVQYLTLSPGTTNYNMSFTVPATAVMGTTYARFRLFIGRLPQGVVFAPTPWDYGGEGEVEDYVLEIEGQEDLDFGDAPSGYPSASHRITGAWIGLPSDPPDPDAGMQHHPTALGDDQDAEGDDEDGFKQTSVFVPGQYGYIETALSIGAQDTATAQVWIDWNKDGVWSHPQELVMTMWMQSAATGFWTSFGSAVAVPASATPGETFARVRVISFHVNDLSPDGYYCTGEVEDHLVVIEPDGDHPDGNSIFGYKWHDLNANGVWDLVPTPEPAIPNWPIWLDLNGSGARDATDPVVMTDASGRYQFNGLPDGTFMVGEDVLPGWVQSYPSAPGTHSVTVAVGQSVTAANFGNVEEGPGPGIGAIKWSQPPLFDPTWQDTTCFFGWDEPTIFMDIMTADDWFCFNPQPVTGIRWWGSYLHWNEEMPPEQAPEMFHIAIWTDVPSSEDNPFSHPAERVWEMVVPRQALEEQAVRCDFFPERMEEPETCYLYQLPLAKEDWFYQDGDMTIYWLSISAIYEEEPPPEHLWGWKTRMHYFNDDAVRFYDVEIDNQKWVYEGGEPIGERWDFAFELLTEEMEWKADFGDAPDPGYATTIMCNGALHRIDTDVRMGDELDSEMDGLPDMTAQGDDLDNVDDEDGVIFLTPIHAGQWAKINVDVRANGFLNVWLDVDRNGHWLEPYDHILQNIHLTKETTHDIEFFVPDDAAAGPAFMRFRFCTVPDVWFAGFARDGEVEDYIVDISTAVRDQEALPQDFRLAPNVPNPFNPTTQIRYELPMNAQVNVSIFNINGQKVSILVDEKQSAGYYKTTWDASDMPSGIYFVKLTAGAFTQSQKIMFIK